MRMSGRRGNADMMPIGDRAAAVTDGVSRPPADPCVKLSVPSSADVAGIGWAFTQNEPLSTGEFISQAERRGVFLDTGRLRQLYRHGVLVPFVYVSGRQVSPPAEPPGPEPGGGGTSLQRLRYARDRGRLVDLGLMPFRPRLPFEKPDSVTSRRWWNGLLYSKHQLLVLPLAEPLLDRVTHSRRGDHFLARLPEPDRALAADAARLRSIAIILAALEARYLPALDPEWMQLTGGSRDEWEHYRAGFDPTALSARLGYLPGQAGKDAEFLLRRARWLDPLPDTWMQLICHAPRKTRDDLTGAALLAMDHREAAEILLLFREDLAGHGQAAALPAMDGQAMRTRLSYRERSLDEDLVELGLSPHPRVVLAVEGDTEYTHVPLVWKELDYPDAPELMRLLNLRGVDHNLEKLAALAVTPLAGERLPPGRPGWLLIKPPTRLIIAVDPDGPRFGTPDAVAKTRGTIMKDVLDSLTDQGVTNPNMLEIDTLVEIRTWPQSCYEYTHFTDDELADAIMTVHHTINGWSREELTGALAYWRQQGKDIKRVWKSGKWDHSQGRPSGAWQYEVSKTELAKALWPVLQARIDQARRGNLPVPPVVAVVRDAYYIAQQWRYHSFALSEGPAAAAT
jgi:hypothetical protein